MKSLRQSQQRQLLFLGLLTVASVIVSICYLDLRAANMFTQEQADRYYRINRTLTDIGEGGQWFLIAILASLIPAGYLKYSQTLKPALISSLETIKLWGRTFLWALIASGLIAHILKFAFGRARPNQTDNHYPWNFEFFSNHWHFHSFPSGHSQTLFSAAVALSFAYPRYRNLFYILAAGLAMTRVFLNQHFFSDVLMGAYIGYAISLIIFNRRFLLGSSSQS